MIDKQQKFLDPRTLAELRGLRLRARQAVEGYVAGLHRSPLQGFSIEFAEHREYSPGDALRDVDWRAYGRTDKFYVKRYEDETNLIAYVVVDTSESMQYKSEHAALSKLEYAQVFAATLAWLVLQQQDAIGLVTFDETLRHVISPSTSRAALKDIVHVLDSPSERRKSDFSKTFHELAERFNRRGIVVILSDLFGDTNTLLSGLRHLRFRQHEVVVFHILDPAEVDFPFDKPTRFHGLEQFSSLTVDPRSIRQSYRKEFMDFLSTVQSGCRQAQIDYRRVRTEQPLDRALTDYLAMRAGRTT